MLPETPDIRTRPDGSIDTDFYKAQGRLARSRTAWATVAAVATAPARFTRWALDRLWRGKDKVLPGLPA